MTTLYFTLYLICAIICFILAVKHEKKQGYVTTGMLVWFTVWSAVWPMSLVLIGLVLFYEWLEKVVNK